MTNKEKPLSVNEKIELARQSGYNEACYIKDKKFKEFISDLKDFLLYGYSWEKSMMSNCENITKEIDKLAGEELIK